MIEYLDKTFINFRSFAFDRPHAHGYRWVDIRRFQLSTAPSTDEFVLRHLIGADQFADDYAGGGIEPVGEIHGPYQLSRIAPDSYEHLDAAAAISMLDGWARRDGSLPAPLAESFEEQLYAPVRNATSLDRLKELGKDDLHDFVVHGEFYELVVVDRASNTLSLVVAADD